MISVIKMNSNKQRSRRYLDYESNFKNASRLAPPGTKTYNMTSVKCFNFNRSSLKLPTCYTATAGSVVVLTIIIVVGYNKEDARQFDKRISTGPSGYCLLLVGWYVRRGGGLRASRNVRAHCSYVYILGLGSNIYIYIYLHVYIYIYIY